MLIIHDSRLPEAYLETINCHYPECDFISLGEESFSETSKVYPSIKFHPDIFICQLSDEMIIHSPNLNENIIRRIADKGIHAISGEKTPENHYPDTCAYNVLKVGRYIFHKLIDTDPVIIEKSNDLGYEIVNVNQGYAGCSSIVINSNAIITSDPGIKKTAIEKNIDVLLVSPGGVILPGENFGFLGGTSGVLPGFKKIFVAGDLSKHTDKRSIYDFLDKYDIKTIEASGYDLYDAGGFIFI